MYLKLFGTRFQQLAGSLQSIDMTTACHESALGGGIETHYLLQMLAQQINSQPLFGTQRDQAVLTFLAHANRLAGQVCLVADQGDMAEIVEVIGQLWPQL